jgi:hypothetical protein
VSNCSIGEYVLVSVLDFERLSAEYTAFWGFVIHDKIGIHICLVDHGGRKKTLISDSNMYKGP